MKPVIAILLRPGMNGNNPCWQINTNYLMKIEQAGGIPMMLAPCPKAELAILLASCDGLLVPGGEDLDPATYHEVRLPVCGPSDPRLDQLDLDALAIAQEQKLPVLGICRGLQSINVFYGGTLIQDLPSELEQAPEVHQKGTMHPIKSDESQPLGVLFGTGPVNSYHHQAIDQPGRGLKIVSWSEDGVIEAIVHETDPVTAVQWHPERLADHRLFARFIEQAKDHQQQNKHQNLD